MHNTVDLAIKRHDIDASHFQSVYSKSESQLTKKEKAFITGRKLVLRELEMILNKIPKGSKVLDIGCGTAHLTKWVEDKGYDVYGLEPSNEMYNYAKRNFPDMKIEKGISSNLPYENDFFDFVIAFEVLRYLDKEENQKTYAEIYRVLKKDGEFFITQVNRYSTDFYFIYYIIKDFYSKLFNKIHHYCNFTTPAREIKTAQAVGFSLVNIIGVFNGSVRFAYKISKRAGDFLNSLVSKNNRIQSTSSHLKAKFKAHLIVWGKK